MLKHWNPNNSTIVTTPLVRALVTAMQAEEAVIDRLLVCAAKGESQGVMNAAQELAALREAYTAENCVD